MNTKDKLTIKLSSDDTDLVQSSILRTAKLPNVGPSDMVRCLMLIEKISKQIEAQQKDFQKEKDAPRDAKTVKK